jgi:hypothetical protein
MGFMLRRDLTKEGIGKATHDGQNQPKMEKQQRAAAVHNLAEAT